jgi:hypothetical protein
MSDDIKLVKFVTFRVGQQEESSESDVADQKPGLDFAGYLCRGTGHGQGSVYDADWGIHFKESAEVVGAGTEPAENQIAAGERQSVFAVRAASSAGKAKDSPWRFGDQAASVGDLAHDVSQLGSEKGFVDIERTLLQRLGALMAEVRTAAPADSGADTVAQLRRIVDRLQIIGSTRSAKLAIAYEANPSQSLADQLVEAMGAEEELVGLLAAVTDVLDNFQESARRKPSPGFKETYNF